MNDKHKLLEELEEQQELLTKNEEQQEVIDDLRDNCDTVQEAVYEAIQDAKNALEHLRDAIDDAIDFNTNYKHELKDLKTVNLTPDLETASKTATDLLSEAERVYHNDIDDLQAALLMISDDADERYNELETEAVEIQEDIEKVEAAIDEEGAGNE